MNRLLTMLAAALLLALPAAGSSDFDGVLTLPLDFALTNETDQIQTYHLELELDDDKDEFDLDDHDLLVELVFSLSFADTSRDGLGVVGSIGPFAQVLLDDEPVPSTAIVLPNLNVVVPGGDSTFPSVSLGGPVLLTGVDDDLEELAVAFWFTLSPGDSIAVSGEATVTLAPEPGTFVLGGLGLVGLLIVGRKRRIA